MNIIKKSLKKKKLLHCKTKPLLKPQIPYEVEEKVKIITLNHKESFHIKGNFSFIVLNGFLKMDFYEVRTHQIHNFNSQAFVNVIGHKVPIKMEDYIHQYQQQPLQSDVYYNFLNYILKNFPNELSILIQGEYEISDFGYMLSEEKLELFHNNYKSAMFIGEKQVGKSTSLLLYANKLLNHSQVFILDTDLGQSLCLPGFINLLRLDKPMFLQKPTILQQSFIGEIQVFNYIDIYLNKVKDNLIHYNSLQLLKDHPLLINTAGFITSYGITIIQELINILQPQICIILSRQYQKRIVEKSDYLYEQLQKKSFLNSQETFKTKIHLLHEYFDFEKYGQTIIEQTPQVRKNYRTQKIAENLGIENLHYLTLCKASNTQLVDSKKLKFIIINETKNYFDIEETGSVFVFSLVAIEVNQNFVGLGFIKDLDVVNNVYHIISQVDFSQNFQYCLLKSKFYNIQQDQIGEMSVEDIYTHLDEQCIENGEPLDYLVHLPYLQTKSEAIGDQKHKITVNKKVY